MQQFPFHFKEETFTLTLKMREEDKSVNHTLFSLDPCIKETYLNDSAFTCPEPHYRPTFLDQPSEIPRQPCIKETYLYDSTVIRPQPHYRPILLDQPSENPRHPRESYFQSPLLYDSTFSPPEAHSRPTLWGQTSENPRQPFIRETYLHDSGLACPQPRYRPTLWDQPNKNPSSLFMKPQLDISGMKCSDTVYRTSPVWADPSTTGIHNLPVLSEVFGTKKKKKTKHNNKRADAVTRHIEDIKRRQNKIDNVDFLKNQLDIPGMISSKTVYRTPPVWAAPSSTGLGPTPDEPFGENKGRKKYCDFKRVNPVFHHLDEQKRNQSKLDNPIGLTPYGLTPIGLSPIGLTPIGLSPIVLTPIGFTPIGLSPFGFTPIGLTPIGLSPIGLTPIGLTTIGFSPMGLSPIGLTPIGLSPIGLSPIDLSPIGLTPIGLTPIGLTPIGLTPIGLSPFGFSKQQRHVPETLFFRWSEYDDDPVI
ncbi:hypothetical protein XELAEV_18019516mg [Xenopus laevis]|uniref:Uncharacterized protein n=1 Tax=Xenopus laevis TaxID=8355 RepID=A0A974DFC0_XENLA|nr:hypothetical protein XELAEV_18019516mg [Xenopus laevis]